MDPLTAVSVGSQALSAVSSLFGGGQKRGPSQRDLIDGQAFVDRNRPSWIMEGAEKAGIHPLAALSLGGMSAPVAQVGGSEPSLGSRISDMGQGISRAVSAYQSREERSIGQKSAALALENQELQNTRLRSEIALMNTAGSPPGMSANPVMDGSNVPKLAYEFVKMPDGKIMRVPTQDMASVMESYYPAGLKYAMAGMLNPTTGYSTDTIWEAAAKKAKKWYTKSKAAFNSYKQKGGN